jgi:hypothetical protein
MLGPDINGENYIHIQPEDTEDLEQFSFLIWRTDGLVFDIWDVVLWRFIYAPAQGFKEVKTFFFDEMGNKRVVVKCWSADFDFCEFVKFLKSYNRQKNNFLK